jgi:hypothetical protein
MVSSSNTYMWPVDDSDRAITYRLTRDAIIYNFLDAGDDLLEVPGVSVEVAEALEDNGIDTVFQLIGLAMIQLGPNQDVEEAAESFLQDLLENYDVLDDMGLITESIFTKVESMMPIGIIPDSRWFESTGIKTQFYAATNTLIQHPQAGRLQDLFEDDIFTSYILPPS